MDAKSVSEFVLDGTTTESGELDFKRGFNPAAAADWCELVKDIVAMANSGGGRIVIGVNDDGALSDEDVAPFLGIDPADITNKIHKYTAAQFSAFRVNRMKAGAKLIAELVIDGVALPIVFTAPGDYEYPPGKTKSAFRLGTVYFRHGAKSEPGTTEDLRNALEREVARVKAFWLDGITKVVEAPAGSAIHVVQAAVSVTSGAETQAVRLTTGGDAPEFRVVDNDQVYPYRMKELLKKLGDALGEKVVSPYDIGLVRKAFGIEANPNYSFQGKFSGRQYSDAFVEWLVDQHRSDKLFFQKLREQARTRR